MKIVLLFILAVSSLVTLSNDLKSQNVPLFDSTYYQFNLNETTTTRRHTAARTADMDNDGDSDVVTSHGTFFSSGFSFLRNLGNGFFSAPTHYAATLFSNDIAVGDFNNDGLKDVVVSNTGINWQGNSVSVFLNLGNAVFGSALNYTIGQGPIGVTTADLDNDGDIDIAVANNGSFGNGSTVSILINNGNANFQTAVTFPGGNAPFKIRAARINNDNLIDLVIANGSRRVNILFNSGNNNFSNRVELISELGYSDGIYGAIAIDDIDNDNDNDILYVPGFRFTGSIDRGSVAIFRNQGNGTFGPVQYPQSPNFTLPSADVELADLNGDGWKDIITTSSTARTSDGYIVYMNNGTGNFNESYLKPAGQNTIDVLPGDVNNDGKIDILTIDDYSSALTVHINFGNGYFPSPVLNPTIDFSSSIDAADFDGDGDMDILTSANGRTAIGVPVAVSKNRGNGTFNAPVLYSIRSGGVQAKFRDLNNDGKPDIVFATSIASPPYDFHYAFNNGNGTFGSVQTKSINACGWGDIEAFDMNNDGFKDVIITEPLGCQNISNSARRIFISLNNGNGTFADPIIKVVNPFPTPIAGGDFNMDGNIDLATGISGGKLDIHLGLGNGDINFPVSQTIGVQESPYDILVTDLNNDGKPDIASCNFYENNFMTVLIGNGNGTFQPAQTYPSAKSPDLANLSGITSGDIDGDNDIDIMVGHNASNSVSVYLNNGSGTFFDYRMRYGIYYGVSSPVFADFTGDAKGDIAAIVSLPPAGFQSAIAVIRGKNNVSSVLNITLIPEGFYNSTSNTLNRKDLVTAYLRSTIFPYAIVDSAKALIDSVTFTGSFNFSYAPSGTYYIVVKHKNSIETWSKSGGEIFTQGSTMNYDFTSSQTQAFGNNLKLADTSPLRYAIFSGDVNQDGSVNLTDIILISNNSANFITGFINTDLNGDSFTNLSDILIAYNNSNGFVARITPG